MFWRRRAHAPQVGLALAREGDLILELLLGRVGVDRRHEARLEPERVEQDLRHRGDGVRRARGVRDEVVLVRRRTGSSLTPRTIVMSGSVAGAEMTTLLAPAVRCCEAPSRSVKRPVDSTTTSTPMSCQGSADGSRSESTLNELPSTEISSAEWLTSPSSTPCVESYLSMCASTSGGARSLTATISKPGLLLQVRPVEVPPDPPEAVDAHLGRHAPSLTAPFEGCARVSAAPRKGYG